jgi:hypothetical protein
MLFFTGSNQIGWRPKRMHNTALSVGDGKADAATGRATS